MLTHSSGPAGRHARWPGGVALALLAFNCTALSQPQTYLNSSTAADCVVTFNEVQYHPANDEAALEWLELHNQMSVDEDLSGWTLEGGVRFTFPSGTVLPAGGYLAVAANPAGLQAITGFAGALGPFTGRLDNGGDRLVLRNLHRRLMDELAYGDDAPWPIAPDGSGATLAKWLPGSPSSPAENWRASHEAGGTPGRPNFPEATPGSEPITDVLLDRDSTGTWHVPDAGDASAAWREFAFDDASWFRGTNGFGFDLSGATPQARAARYYPLENSAADASGNHADGRLAGGPSFISDAPLTLAASQFSLQLDGMDDAVEVDEPVVPTGYTLSAWVRLDEVRSCSLVLLTSSRGPTSDWSHQIRVTADGRFEQYAYDGGGPTVTGTTVAQPGRWYHVCATATNQGLMHLYVDGVEEGTAQPVGTMWTGGSRWVFGSNSGGSAFFCKGRLDDVAIWHEVISAAQVAALHAGQSPMGLGGLVGLFVTDTASAMRPAHAGAWFRLPFNVPTGARYDQLSLDMRFDDGFVAWLNGEPLVARNAPADPAWDASATTERPAGAAATPEAIDLTAFLGRLRPGRNVLAIHGLNARADDADFLVEPMLRARRAPATEVAAGLVFSEMPSASLNDFWCEVVNGGSKALALSQYSLRCSNGQVFLPADATLSPGERRLFTAAELGFQVLAGDRLFLLSRDFTQVLDAARVTATPRARREALAGAPFFTPSEITPGEANRFAFRDEIVINEILYHAPPTYRRPGTPATYTWRPALNWTSTWRFEQSGTDLLTAWREPGFDDSAWAGGPGILGYRAASLPEPIRTPFALGQWTYYFRAPFVVQGATNPAQVQVRTLIDDGGVLYLNGREFYRQKMPDGDVAYTTPAINVGDPFITGPLTLTVTNLVEGTNWLAAEVHQWNLGSSDVVFGLELAVAEAVVPGTPDTPFAENDEQWVELHNRSDHAVDLGGWRLADAVSFTFATNTVLEPGAFLVVTRDLAAFAAAHPGVRAVGNFSGRLSHRSDHLVLRDPTGNPADEVRYHDGRPWPAAPDGGGSSLELRDPRADNARPGAWAASNETPRSGWAHYEFTQRAVEPVFGPPLNGFHELRLGLLDDGEVLLDNVSVLEAPGGAARELMQNGGFDAGPAQWRLLGNHSRSRVIDDPDRPGNKVLHLVATDARGYLANQIETTLKAGGNITPVIAGTEYRIAFDAKWLTGSPQLHSELYYNRVARTTILQQPALPGTPGRRNSAAVANLGPTGRGLHHWPLLPKPGDAITVSLEAADPDGVAGLTLWSSVNGGAWSSVPMTATGADHFSATLPAQADGAVIQFYVVASDALGATTFLPAGGPDSRALIRVDTRQAGPKRRAFHFILTAADGQWLDTYSNMMSDDRLGATVIWDGREVYYDCGVHLHGSMFSRNNPDAATYNVQFPSDQRFRGVHRTIQVKRRIIQEIIAKFVQTQSGVPGMYEDIVHLFSHRPANAGAARMSLAHYNDVFLDSQYPDGSDGILYNMEGIRVAEGTDDGTPEGNKTPFPVGWIGNYDLTDLGDDPEQYRWTTMLRNNRARDEFAPYIAMAKAFSLSGTALDQAVPGVIDVDEWLRVFALLSLFGIDDIYTQGNPHNLNMYARPSDGRLLAFPYDWDFFFARGPEAPLWGDQNVGKIIGRPVFTRAYYGNLLDLMETTFNADYLARWVPHFGAVAGEDYSYVLERVRQRNAYVRARLPAPVTFAILSNGGEDFAVTTSAVALEGAGWIDVHTVRLAGAGITLPLTWQDDSRWRLTAPLLAPTNRLELQALNRRGELVGQDVITVTTTAPDDSQRAYLRLTEIMYHPAPPNAAELAAGITDGDRFEFLELLNTGPGSVSLDGVRFTLGIQFDFTNSSIRELAAGARVLVVRDLAAFTLRYGAGLPVAGVYSGGLDNGGETLRLVDRLGLIIQELTYDDAGAWPVAADGAGYSLERLDPAQNEWLPANWRPSVESGGSPGRAALTRPRLELTRANGDGLRFQFRGEAGQAYRVLWTDQVPGGEWRVLESVPADTVARDYEVFEPWPAGGSQRFYQVVTP